ncbi:acyl-CoA thioesterase [Paenibacillus septentrionalis]|uniref:Acyl-CoA thioesterase n=1 Tax=Paenibacillus septentrionalis TaxID=429342 RepID=A0ABW1V2X9_9BACL
MSEHKKKPSESMTLMTQLIFPSDTNHYDTMFGGRLMEYMDKAAAIAAMRHARTRCVTASMDSIDFLAPIMIGEVIEVKAFVSWTHRSSMEIYVTVTSENLFSGEKKHNVEAFFTFVALDEAGKPTPVVGVEPETKLEKELFASAPERHDSRRKRKLERKNSALQS